MIEEIKRKYEDFGDAVISQVCYSRTLEDKGIIQITLAAMNSENEYVFENIKLTLSDISTFRFVEMNNVSSLIINGAVLAENEGIITLDFFPEISASGNTINEASDFLIRCYQITYELL